jgi:hypothetical protein
MIMIKRFFLFPILLFCCCLSIAAQSIVPELKWSVFTVEDLKMKEWAEDTSVSAVILGNVGDLSMEEVRQFYGFRFTELKRIKIFKKTGFDYANVSIPYYSKGDIQQVERIRAQTITPDGYKHQVEPKSVVYEKLNDKWSVAKFTFPKVTEGCILEYEYDLTATQLFELREWYFQDRIPTRFSVLNIDIWSRYEYQYLFQGESNLKSTKPKYDRAGRTYASFYVNDLPGLKDEKFITSINDHLTRIRFQLSKYFSTSSGARIEVIKSWEGAADELLSNDNLGKKILKKSRYNKVLEASQGVFSPADSTKAKVQKLYDWVNKNISWDGHYYLWSDKDPNDVWQKRKAGSSDINFLLLALLKEAGVNAQPVLVSTRKNGKPYTNFPIIDQFDHCLILVEFENKQTMLIDAGNAGLTMGLTCEQALNGKGWLLRKKDPIWFDIKPAISTQVISAKFDISDEGNLKGTISTIFRGNIAADQRNAYQGDTMGKSKMTYLKKKNADWQIESISVTNLDKTSEPLRETINCTIANTGQVNGNRIYLKPTLKSGWEANPFKMEKRSYPVEFPYPTNDQYILTLNIPEGYKVEELPQSMNLGLPPEDARFTYAISSDEKTIKLAVKIQINKIIVPADDYPFLKNFFNQVAAKLDEMIVLKKIAK